MELEELYARLDPLDGYQNDEQNLAQARDLLERLRGLGPDGKEHAWAQLVDGLLGLI